VSEAKKQPHLRLRRNPEGEVYHLDGISPTLGIEVRINPLTYGASRNMETFGQPLLKWSAEDKFYLLTNHLVRPELDLESVEDMEENFDAWTIEDLVQAVAVYSGLARLYEDDTEGNVEGEANEEDKDEA
jgi:hypothetical protein